ncbi:MAG: hypothetical protein AAGA86_05615, partial [Bacteroidota bacterium]
GHCQNLEERLRRHNQGNGAPYTKRPGTGNCVIASVLKPGREPQGSKELSKRRKVGNISNGLFLKAKRAGGVPTHVGKVTGSPDGYRFPYSRTLENRIGVYTLSVSIFQNQGMSAADFPPKKPFPFGLNLNIPCFAYLGRTIKVEYYGKWTA